MVRRDLRWRAWFVLSYILGLAALCLSLARGWRRHENAHHIIITTSTHHADILRTGGFLDPDEPAAFPEEE